MPIKLPQNNLLMFWESDDVEFSFLFQDGEEFKNGVMKHRKHHIYHMKNEMKNEEWKEDF